MDDLLSVPFSPEELVARVLAVLRRTAPAGAALRPVLRLGELEIDILHRRVRAGASELHLTALELSLLYLLAANAGRVVTRDEILDHLWGVDYAAESNVVDRHVRNLRATLQDDWRRPRYIATVPGRGYRFLPTAPADDPPPAPPPRRPARGKGRAAAVGPGAPPRPPPLGRDGFFMTAAPPRAILRPRRRRGGAVRATRRVGADGGGDAEGHGAARAEQARTDRGRRGGGARGGALRHGGAGGGGRAPARGAGPGAGEGGGRAPGRAPGAPGGGARGQRRRRPGPVSVASGGRRERPPHGAVGAPRPPARAGPPAERGRWAALGWLLRRFPEPEATEWESLAADRAAVAAQVAALRARTPDRAAPVEAVLTALTGRAPG